MTLQARAVLVGGAAGQSIATRRNERLSRAAASRPPAPAPQLWMAVTASGSAEQIAVSSLIAYDVYR